MVQVFTSNKHLLSSFSHNNCVVAALNPQMFENGQTAWVSSVPLCPCALTFQSNTHVWIGRLQTNTADFQHLCFWFGFSIKTWICCTTTVISKDVSVCAFAIVLLFVCHCSLVECLEYVYAQVCSSGMSLHRRLLAWRAHYSDSSCKCESEKERVFLSGVAPVFSGSPLKVTLIVWGCCAEK